MGVVISKRRARWVVRACLLVRFEIMGFREELEAGRMQEEVCVVGG